MTLMRHPNPEISSMQKNVQIHINFVLVMMLTCRRSKVEVWLEACRSNVLVLYVEHMTYQVRGTQASAKAPGLVQGADSWLCSCQGSM